ncbi:uncharacterized protein LOC101451958 [Ceratitis capitata]|uniref:(Mediterranean fruit fly) hypothetical protein n=1 Tax=Ceratitis capitata TaxID=7213 RepID=W8CBX0_CERCA|nr:uncharacterized protein LOC101451958 [Ceratitis capitata]CAD6993872.1 unnamed protein product [Ceratitis capitata]
MAFSYPDITKLPKCANEITNSAEYIKYLPAIATKTKSKEDAECVLQHIAAVIEYETSINSRCGSIVANQVVLNTAYRAYFQLSQQHQFPGTNLYSLPQTKLLYSEECGFQLIYAILLTNHKSTTIKPEELITECSKALSDAIDEDCGNILYILRVINLLVEKFPTLNANVSLQQIYYCLQDNQFGMREETLNLFSNCCRQKEYALANFHVILEFWPWSNRYKFYLMSCIFKQYNLNEFLRSAQHSADEFYAGVRLSLSHKSLLSASQHLIKALSAQKSRELLNLCADILIYGTVIEIKNFYAHWFGRIEQKHRLFEYVQCKPEIINSVENRIDSAIELDCFRSTLIFTMFSRQIFPVSKLHFFKISTELITNCSNYGLDTQMLIFKLIVDNLSNFSIEDCLEFSAAFIKAHKNIENAQYRNEILGKIPVIVNYVAKTFCKLHDGEGTTTLEDSIQTFFKQLHQIIETDICSDIYQPKIFSLRLLDILLKSLYADQLSKNTKNCSLAQNKNLGNFLVAEKVFDAAFLTMELFKLLDDPFGFNDALDLIVGLLKQINFTNVEESVRCCKEFSRRNDVDECALSTLYARVTVNCCRSMGHHKSLEYLLDFALTTLTNVFEDFQADPLQVCKTKNHLFGFINIAGEVVKGIINLTTEKQSEILSLLERVLNLILNLLNSCKSDPTKAATNAPSFQDMDESLEMLVKKSSYQNGNNSDHRKFLLMSFWLTLKASCDLATEIGVKYVSTVGNGFNDNQILKLCLDISVTVLTRCRHKGAIEAAGVSIGKLAKNITTHCSPTSEAYSLLYNCLDFLLDNKPQVSVTRRGAGFSIMMLHIVKNEQQRTRPLLKSVMEKILTLLKSFEATGTTTVQTYDRLEALLLHYLCVLVRDTELRDAASYYYKDILLVTLKRIEHPEWTEFNAALQLFGALVPKIVGQSPAKDFEAPAGNENNDITYDEIVRKLPTICEYILNYFDAKKDLNTNINTTILFLSFLAKIKHLPKQIEPSECAFLHRIRVLTWHLLAHRCDNVRKLAALCFVRAHDFRLELPQAILNISNMVGNVNDENLFLGLLATISEGVLRMQHESMHTSDEGHKCFLKELRSSLTDLKVGQKYTPYTLSKLFDICILVDLNSQSGIMQELLKTVSTFDDAAIGLDVFQQSVQKFKSST